MKLKLKLAKILPKRERVKTQLELDIEEQLKTLEQIRAQKEELYIVNVQTFEAMSQLEGEEQVCLNIMKRLAHTSPEPPEGLNMITRKLARVAEGQNFVIEVGYKRAADYYELSELPKDILGKPGVVKEINSVKIDMLSDPRCEKARRKGKWLTPSVYVKRLEEATPPGGDPKWT